MVANYGDCPVRGYLGMTENPMKNKGMDNCIENYSLSRVRSRCRRGLLGLALVTPLVILTATIRHITKPRYIRSTKSTSDSQESRYGSLKSTRDSHIGEAVLGAAGPWLTTIPPCAWSRGRVDGTPMPITGSSTVFSKSWKGTPRSVTYSTHFPISNVGLNYGDV